MGCKDSEDFIMPELPAAQVNEIKGRLRSQWQIEANALRVRPFKSQQQANAEGAKLNAKYQRLEFDALTELQQQQQEQERVQQLIKQPRKMGRAEEAGLRMELRPEAEALVFPPEPKPYSVSEITSPRLMESIQDFANAAPSTPELFTRASKEPKTEQGIINQYLGWRELIQYDAINPRRQQQLDMQWDAYMAGDERFDKWWSNKKKRQPTVEIKALRTPGDMGKIMRERIVGTGGITPLGESIIKKMPLTPETAAMKAGKGISELFTKPKPVREAPQKVIRQRNKRTGEQRISYDGGKTWRTP